MDKVKQAAAIMGRKGGRARVPKGFSKSGKAQQAGRETAVKRWGKAMDVTLRIRWLERQEPFIIAEADRLVGLEDKTSIAEALSLLLLVRCLNRPELERLGFYAYQVSAVGNKRNVTLPEGWFEWLKERSVGETPKE